MVHLMTNRHTDKKEFIGSFSEPVFGHVNEKNPNALNRLLFDTIPPFVKESEHGFTLSKGNKNTD